MASAITVNKLKDLITMLNIRESAHSNLDCNLVAEEVTMSPRWHLGEVKIRETVYLSLHFQRDVVLSDRSCSALLGRWVGLVPWSFDHAKLMCYL